MSDLSKKIFAGISATDKDWEKFLQNAHQEAPGMTQAAFENHATSMGPNTYEVLAQALERAQGKDISVLDLACGDGPLLKYILPKISKKSSYTGVDMVASEIAQANENNKDPRAQFLVARAQELPFEDESFDFVLCHLALMLMLPLEPVLQEIRRVLKTGGKLIAAYSSNKKGSTMFTIMQPDTVAFLQSKLDQAATFKTGDARLGEEQELPELLLKHGLSLDKLEQYTIFIKGKTEMARKWFQDFYMINILPEEDRTEFWQKFDQDLVKLKQKGDEIMFENPIFLMECSKH